MSFNWSATLKRFSETYGAGEGNKGGSYNGGRGEREGAWVEQFAGIFYYFIDWDRS